MTGVDALAPHRLAGLDISVRATGACVGGATTVLRPRASSHHPERRLLECYDAVCAWLHRSSAQAVVAEGYVMQGMTHAPAIALWWWLRVWCYEEGLPWLVVPPTTLKLYATGRGHARKPAMAAAREVATGYADEDDNANDAWWLWALGCHAHGAPQVPVMEGPAARALRGLEWATHGG